MKNIIHFVSGTIVIVFVLLFGYKLYLTVIEYSQVSDTVLLEKSTAKGNDGNRVYLFKLRVNNNTEAVYPVSELSYNDHEVDDTISYFKRDVDAELNKEYRAWQDENAAWISYILPPILLMMAFVILNYD